MNIQLVDAWWVQFKNKMSIRLAAVFGAASAIIVAYPSLLLSLTDNFPGHYKAFVSGAVFMIVFGVPTFTALVKQPKLEAKVAAKVEEKAEMESNDAPTAA